MKQNQNVIVAIVLSFLVIFGWQTFIIQPKIEAERQRIEAEEARTQDAAPGTVTGTQAPGATTGTQAPETPGAPAAPAAAPSAPAATAPVAMPREQALAQAERVAIDTPSLKGSINLQGGRIDDLLLARYHVTVERSSPLVELFSPAGSEHPYYADFGWVDANGAPAAPADAIWRAEGGPLSPGNDVTLTWDNGAGLTFRKIYSVDDKYMFTVRQSVDNATNAPVTLFPFGIINRTGLPQTTGYYILHEGLIGYLGEEGLFEINYQAGGFLFFSKRNVEEEPSITPAPTNSGWLGITDKYWASALAPAGEESFRPRFLRTGSATEPSFQADFLGDGVNVPPGGSSEHQTMLFAGAKETAVLDAYQERHNIPQFDLLIDWGWFYFITKPLFQLIDWLFRFLGNFGLAILAVTVLVKLVFFPLANRSYASMTKMKKVQPEMMKLQERFKDDRMGLQREMMELYKREKVNPIAGCWPILIQIPVFFALYKVLFVTIEMRHAPFYGWIRDLSAPDPTSIFNLFGLIPWNPPLFLMLGVWPLIMGVTMFVQMRMNPTPPDKTQAMIFNWMPVIFTFMLASFPAGLVIYWAWNNLLSILQQGVIMKRHGVPIELFGNLKGMFAKPKPKDTPAE
jgi:YidC/Oxa1 family membrane protein insertase